MYVRHQQKTLYVGDEVELPDEVIEHTVSIHRDGKHKRSVEWLEHVAGDAEEHTCATDETDCSRTVDSKGETCWQHPEDDSE